MNSGKLLLMFTGLSRRYKNRYKWTARWRDVGSSFPDLSVSTFTCLPTQKLSAYCTVGNFMETSSCRHDPSLTQSLVSLSFLDHVSWGWGFQGYHDILVFLETNPYYETIQEPTKRHIIKPKDTLVTWNIPRDLEALCQEPGSKSKY